MRRLLGVLLPVLLASLTHGADADDRDEKDANVKTGALFEAIMRMDRHLFDAFNAHNVDRLMSMATRDLEFYQDSEGLKGYQQCVAEFKKMFADTPDIRRELVEGSAEVYPIKDYGALEIGQQRFCHTENGREDCTVFAFAMLWQKTAEDSWKIARVISYGH